MALAAATALLSGLTACAPETVGLDPENRPTLAPEQSPGEACAVSKTAVDDLVSQVQRQIDAAGASVASGKLPDFSSSVEKLRHSIAAITDGVSNPEVLAALDEVRTQIDGFSDIAAPGSVIEVPQYLTRLGTQLKAVQDAAKRMQLLCDAG